MPESHTFGPEQPDDTNDIVHPKKRRGSALSRYLFQRRSLELADATTESQDADSEAEEKPKRLRGLLGKIFPKIVEKSDVVDQPKKKEFSPEIFFGWTGPVKQEDIDNKVSPDVEQVGSSTSSPESTTTSVTAESAEVPIASSPEQETILNVQEQSPKMATEGEMSTIVEQQAPVVKDQRETWSNGIDQSVRLQDQLIQRPEVQSNSYTVERETVVEHRGSALPYVLLGAEYVARKSADKKLEQRVTNKMSETSTEVSRAAQLQQELNRVVQQNREQLEALKQQRQMPEFLTPVEQPKPANMEVETQPDPAVLHIERSPAPIEKDQPETVQRKIFEQVAEAAEQNVPVERVFERSHEVKDDKTTPFGAASVGAVVAAKVAQSPVPDVIQTTQTSSAQGDLPVVADKPDTDEYQQAMKMGFWSAIMIIIVGSIAYLMLQ